MNSASESKKPDPLRLKVTVRLEQIEDEKLPNFQVYVFDQTGQFVTCAPWEGDSVKLKLPEELRGTTARILFGPPLSEKEEEVPAWMRDMLPKEAGPRKTPLPSTLVRRGAYEKRIRLRTAEEHLDIAVLPPDWKKWLMCPCVVRGRLVKRLTLPDGTTKELGVCGACVCIYEVDSFPYVILQLAEHELYRLRNDLRFVLDKLEHEHPPRVWPPEPWPDGPHPQPGPPPPYEHAAASFEAKIEDMLPRHQLRTDLEPVFNAISAPHLRQALMSVASKLLYVLCLPQLKWLSHYYHKDWITCTPTDEQGRFQTTIWYHCFGDKPDLYFKAWQCINGALHVVYNPGVACHTHWNYECGTEVVLEVTDPAARTCVPTQPVNPPPGVTRWVMPFAVGGTQLYRIKSNGKTDYNRGPASNPVSIVDAPFGSPSGTRLGFRHGHSSDIPLTGAHKPAYYRWRYRKAGTSNWHDLSEPVVRHYVEERPGVPPVFPAYKLGPTVVKGIPLYEFKPHDPPAPSDSNATTRWPIDEWFADIFSGFLRSFDLPGGVAAAAGKYEIKLEVYDEDVNRIPPGPGTFEFIVPTGYASDGETVEARNATAAEIDNNGFVFHLHIDNRACKASIAEPAIGSETAGTCGLLRYDAGDVVTISFKAQQPDDHAVFWFKIKRGYGWLANTGSGWQEVGATTASPYAGDGSGNFTNDFAVTALLGKNCDEGAFAESLSVWAKATNGWHAISAYDAYDLRAFALAPNKEE